MLISLPRDESTILLMDLHLTKILAVGKPNFIEVNRIINIARSALGVFLGGRVGQGDRRWCFAKTESNVWVWLSQRCRTSKHVLCCLSPLSSPPALLAPRGGEVSSNVSILRASLSLLQAVKVQTSAGNGISVRRWDGWSKGAIFYKFWKSFFSFWAPTPG